MSTRPDQVQVKIGGVVQSTWSDYDIDSDLMVPADAWRVTLRQASIEVPAQVVEGAAVEVALVRDGAAETVLTGRLDLRRLRVGRGQHELVLSGRDGASV